MTPLEVEQVVRGVCAEHMDIALQAGRRVAYNTRTQDYLTDLIESRLFGGSAPARGRLIPMTLDFSRLAFEWVWRPYYTLTERKPVRRRPYVSPWSPKSRRVRFRKVGRT